MTNILNTIIQRKYQEIDVLHQQIGNDFDAMSQYLTPKAIPFKFKMALQQSGLNVIAEVKRRSPSKGLLAEIPDAAQLALQYANGGAAAISVLTDQAFFGGKLEDLKEVSRMLKDTSCAVLRKDFIVDRMQIIEAAAAGADAVLLIASVLQHRLKDFIQDAKLLGLDALVEIHEEAELVFAVESGAEIIGINNRNLNTFVVDHHRALSLLEKLPSNVIKVSESGIQSVEDASRCHQAGFNAVLMGEVLVKAANPGMLINEIKSVCQP